MEMDITPHGRDVDADTDKDMDMNVDMDSDMNMDIDMDMDMDTYMCQKEKQIEKICVISIQRFL